MFNARGKNAHCRMVINNHFPLARKGLGYIRVVANEPVLCLPSIFFERDILTQEVQNIEHPIQALL